MTQKLMSDARQTQLVEATRKAADLHLEGMGASEAVAKCAAEIDANPHVLQRMVEAFNTAKTLAHLKTAEADERAQSFETADYEVARKLLFPEGEQAKSALAAPELGEIPDPFGMMSKAASEGEIPDVLRVEAPVRELDLARRYKLAFQELDRMRKTAQDHRLEGERFRLMYEGAMSKLAGVFRQSVRPDWSMFEAEAKALYKEAAAPFLDAVYAEGRLASIKVARDAVTAPIYINSSTEIHKLLKIAMYAADLAAEEFATSQKIAADHEAARVELISLGLEKTAIDPIVGFAAYSGMQNMMDKALDKQVEDMIPKDKPTAEFSQDVGIESELSKARMQATLRDLMEGDDVVAQHAQENPQAVTQAVQELTRMSPEIAQNPMLLRGALRRQLEMGQLEPFELQQIQSVARPAQGGVK